MLAWLRDFFRKRSDGSPLPLHDTLALRRVIITIFLLLAINPVICAELAETPDLSHDRWLEYSKRLNKKFNEPRRITWSLYFDNDLFTDPGRDRDDTGGITAAFSGTAARDHFFSIDGLLGSLNGLLNVDHAYNEKRSVLLHAYEVGMVVFTPDNIRTKEPLFDDRPYASLVYISNTRQYFQPEKKV